ncbi:hypothetical protein V502_09513 [Pseudogymnoascus sp. VKM F-4520 (FW-2644)]|nr:hypothetical protein V502_09513 [Pseudogymnoascus sp. VKM F-4520 (FW-2644)]
MDDQREVSESGQAGQGSSSDGPAVTGSGRAIQACDRCRMKKVRCDGIIPTCGRCQAAGLECLTMVKLTRKSYPRSYTESIEERLRIVEGEAQKMRAENAAKEAKIQELELAMRSRSVSHAQSPKNPDHHPPRALGLTSSGRRDNRAKPRAITVDDSICREVGRMNSDREGVGRYIGSSSGIFFVGMAEQRFSTLKSNVQWKIGHDLLKVETDDHSVEYKVYPTQLRKDFLQELPPYETALKCCEAWFEFWRYIFPILHRPTFMRNLELMYFKQQTEPDVDIPAEIFGILYMVLALGSRQIQLTSGSGDDGPHVRSSGDDTIYFEKAMSYYDAVIKLGTLRTVQFLELQALWYVFTGKRSLALQTTGSIVKLSLELGLHRYSRRFDFNPVTTEIRKRIFWVCYILDSFLSTIAGSPKSLRDQDIDADGPSEVDDDLVSAEGYVAALPGEPTGMMAFVALVKVARILAQTLEILYTTTNRRGTPAKIRSLDRLLDQWANVLPDHLQVSFVDMALMSPEEALADLGQGAPEVVFIQLVYLYARLVIHRPALSFKPQTDQSQASLLKCMEVNIQTLLLLSHFRQYLLVFDINPGAHVYTVWQCGLMLMYGLLELRDAKEKHGTAVTTKFELAAKQSTHTCLELLEHMVSCGRDGERVRAQNIRDILTATAPLLQPISTSEPSSSTGGVDGQSNVSSAYATAPQLSSGGLQHSGSPFSRLLSFKDNIFGSGSPLTSQTLNHSSGFATSNMLQPDPETPVQPALNQNVCLDFSNDLIHPYYRFGIADNPMFLPNSPRHRGTPASATAPRDIWDDPVFAYSGSPPMVPADPIGQTSAGAGRSDLPDAGPDPKRTRFENHS